MKYEFFGSPKQMEYANDIIQKVLEDIEVQTKDLKEREKREGFDYKSDKVRKKALEVVGNNIRKSGYQASFIIKNRDKFENTFYVCFQHFREL